MQSTTLLKTALNPGVPMDRATLVIDLGNGLVKALYKAPGSDAFKDIQFPSFVTETTESNSDCIRIMRDGATLTYLVGERAAQVPMSHTGKDEQGKVDNALILLLHTLRIACGNDQHIHADVIFTSPSNKAYGSEISAQLQGLHTVTTPADAEVIGSEAKVQTINIHRAIPQLEGHYAFSQLKLKRDSWIVDCGNRTVICTKVNPQGRILVRKFFGGVGVRGMAESIATNESLSAHLKEHDIERVIDFLMGDVPACVASDIAKDVSACTAQAVAFMSDDSPRFLIGGGAYLPGLADVFGAKVAKNPQWINISALSAMASKILGA